MKLVLEDGTVLAEDLPTAEVWICFHIAQIFLEDVQKGKVPSLPPSEGYRQARSVAEYVLNRIQSSPQSLLLLNSGVPK